MPIWLWRRFSFGTPTKTSHFCWAGKCGYSCDFLEITRSTMTALCFFYYSTSNQTMTKSYQFHLTEQSYRWIVSCLFCQKTSFVVCESKGPIFHRLRFHTSEVYEGSHEYYNTLLQGSNSFSNYSLQHPKPFQFVLAFEFALLKALSLHCYHYILNAYFVSNEFHLSMDCFICLSKANLSSWNTNPLAGFRWNILAMSIGCRRMF